MKSFYEKLLQDEFNEFLLEFPFIKVDEVKKINEFSISKRTVSLSSFSYENINIEIMFDSKKSAYQFIFDKFSKSEISYLDSIINFYLTLSPKKYQCNQTEIIKINISGDIFISFSNFKLQLSHNKENYYISFINDNFDKYKSIKNFSFDCVYNYFIDKIRDLLYDISGRSICNYDTLTKILKIESSRDLIKFKSSYLINYITDVEYAINLRKLEKIKIFDNYDEAKSPKENEIYAIGNKRLKKNISHIAKHKETVIIINRESLHFLYEILGPVLKYEEIIYIEKIISTMLKYFKAYNTKEYNELVIKRKNIDKKEIKNIIPINSLFEFNCWPINITVGTSITIWADDMKLKFYDFKSAYDDINEILIKKIAKELKIEPSDVTDDSYELISMMKY